MKLSTKVGSYGKVLLLAERVKVIDFKAKGKFARAIVLSTGIGKMKIQGIHAKKTLILQSWKAGTNEKIQYFAAKQGLNCDLGQKRPKLAATRVLDSWVVSS